MRPTIVFLSIPSQVASILRNPFEIYYHVTVSWMIFFTKWTSSHQNVAFSCHDILKQKIPYFIGIKNTYHSLYLAITIYWSASVESSIKDHPTDSDMIIYFKGVS
jgi:hypothetical protein